MAIKIKYYQLKNILISEYLRLYLKRIIDNLKKSDTCKIRLTVTINFFFLR